MAEPNNELDLQLEQVRIDNRLNPRIGALDQEAVQEYAANIEALPPMVAFEVPGEGYLLVAGFHRYAAHQLAGVERARFIVHQGDREAAREFADLDNLKNGLRLNRMEKRAVIARYLKRHAGRSDAWIARECYTTDKTVRSVRQELEARSEIPRLERLRGQDGVERPRSVERPVPPAEEPEPDWLQPGPREAERSEPPPVSAAPAPAPPPPPAPAPQKLEGIQKVEPDWLLSCTLKSTGMALISLSQAGQPPQTVRSTHQGRLLAELAELLAPLLPEAAADPLQEAA